MSMRLPLAALSHNWRGLLKVTLFVLLIVTANLLSERLVDVLTLDLRPSNEDFVHRLVNLSAAAYAVMIAIPFVPGVEIGFALIAMFSPQIIFLVYVSTVLGLTIAFVVGRCVPVGQLAKFLDAVGLRRASALMRTVEPLDMDERTALFMMHARNRVVSFLLRYRYLTLAILVNLPGNIIIGGGGGISFVAGASRLYSLPGFMLTIALAVSPIPLLVLVLGPKILQHWSG